MDGESRMGVIREFFSRCGIETEGKSVEELLVEAQIDHHQNHYRPRRGGPARWTAAVYCPGGGGAGFSYKSREEALELAVLYMVESDECHQNDDM